MSIFGALARKVGHRPAQADKGNWFAILSEVLITGATGFLGRAVTSRLNGLGISTEGLGRNPAANAHGRFTAFNIDGRSDWSPFLKGKRAVIHLAGSKPDQNVSEAQFQDGIADAADNLVEQARFHDVQTIIFVSSIAALGGNCEDRILNDTADARPVTAYGRAKLDAERSIEGFAASRRTGISLRPPLVYGARARGSWAQLQRLAFSPLPLPLRSVDNRRSVISVENLSDAIARILTTARPGQSGAYCIAETPAVSLRKMIKWLREGMQRNDGLFACPPALLRTGMTAIGRSRQGDSLFGNLIIDDERFRRTFDWTQINPTADEIRRSGQEFAAIRR
jgi:UDP-glucose 4-epimerase